MLKTAEKFILHNSFDQEADQGPTQLELEYARGVEDGKAEGHQAGYQEAMASMEAKAINILQTFKDEIEQVYLQFDSLVESNTRYSIDLTRKIAEKLYLNLADTTILDRVMKILEDALPLVVEQRRLIFYVNPILVDPLTKRLSESPEFGELARRLEVVGSDLFSESECKLAWNKGSLDVNPAETWTKIAKIIDKHISQHKPPSEEPDPVESAASPTPESPEMKVSDQEADVTPSENPQQETDEPQEDKHNVEGQET